jgi:hypothetical protein
MPMTELDDCMKSTLATVNDLSFACCEKTTDDFFFFREMLGGKSRSKVYQVLMTTMTPPTH